MWVHFPGGRQRGWGLTTWVGICAWRSVMNRDENPFVTSGPIMYVYPVPDEPKEETTMPLLDALNRSPERPGGTAYERGHGIRSGSVKRIVGL